MPGWICGPSLQRLFGLSVGLLLALGTTTCADHSSTGAGSACSSVIDFDGDGLSDEEECRLGTNPLASDTDSDGISDGDERKYGTDPTRADSDGDGLIDSAELRYPKICVAGPGSAQRRDPTTGAAPVCTSESDCQSAEVCLGLSPTRADSDGDGIKDSDEDENFDGVIDFAGHETDPRLLDTDGDSLPDSDGGTKLCLSDGPRLLLRAALPLSNLQLSYDPVFESTHPVTPITGTVGALLLDDWTTGVSAVVTSRPSSEPDVTADRIAIEDQLATVLTGAGATVTGVLVGRKLTPFEQLTATLSTYRVARTTSASTLRDVIAAALTGVPVSTGVLIGADASFSLDVAIVHRTSSDDVIVALSPASKYDDPSSQTASRVSDLVNALSVADGSRAPAHLCQGLKATRGAAADIVWTVDVTQSMGALQSSLAKTTPDLVKQLQAAGVSFRVGVFAASSTAPDLSATGYPGWETGFRFVPGDSADSAYQLCRLLTAPGSGSLGFCPQDGTKANDKIGPFGDATSLNANEEPVAQAVLLSELLKRNAALPTDDYKWRGEAAKIALLLTDSPSSTTDYARYFSSTAALNPSTGQPWGVTYDPGYPKKIAGYFKDNGLLPIGFVVGSPRRCADGNPDDLARCVLEAGGGGYLDVTRAGDAETQAATSRIADAIASAASPFVLARAPIPSTLRVTLNGQDVPRSRKDGFDYDPAMRALVFRGSRYRPQIGDIVGTQYRVWH